MIADVVTAALQIADEVLVIDSGSTDETVALAKQAGAKIMEQPWLGNGRQKRVGEDGARHDWLLDLDADEIISPALAAEITAVFAAGEPAYGVYRTDLALVPPIGEAWLTFGRQRRHKLYDRRVVRQPDHDAWDQFDIPAGLHVGRLEHPILHHAFEGVAGFQDKLNKHSSVRAETLALKPAALLALRIVFGFPFYFARKYILQQYFRGGIYGFALAALSAQGRWLKDVKMWERTKRERDGQNAARR